MVEVKVTWLSVIEMLWMVFLLPLSILVSSWLVARCCCIDIGMEGYGSYKGWCRFCNGTSFL